MTALTHTDLLSTLLQARSLGRAGGRDLVDALAEGRLDPAVAGAILGILRVQGTDAATLAGIAEALRDRAVDPQLPLDRTRPVVDTCGTGGDGSGSLNLSTGAGLLAAACGLQVAKHGNRSISSRSGSSDVLAALGVPTDGPALQSGFVATGFAYLHAPAYHPAMAAIAPVRRALGVRTVFNLVGPLCSPARPSHQVLGVARPHDARLVARALADLGGTGLIVHGTNGWDEATPVAPFLCLTVRDGEVTESTRDPLDAGVARCHPAELLGGSAQNNAHRLAHALAGHDTRAHRDALCLGAGLALEVAGQVQSLADGVEAARQVLARGDAADLLEALSQEVSDAG